MFVLASKADIVEYWSWASPLIQKALDEVQCYQTIDSIKSQLLSGQQQLWAMFFPSEAIIVTQVVELPLAKVCFLMYCAGDNLAELLGATEDSVVSWAKSQGCSRLIMAGRKGWTKALESKGYSMQAVVLEREI